MGSLLILCLVQGLTEFLPVSSSGHLILVPHLLGWEDQGVVMDVVLHMGTLVSVLGYFWRDIGDMIKAVMRFLFYGISSFSAYLAFTLLLATLPAVAMGFFIKRYLIADLRNSFIIALASIGFGLLLYAADRWGKKAYTLNSMTASKGVLIGLAQVMAFIPGTSRSGICLTAARALGFERQAAMKFTFLMAIPVILSGTALALYDVFQTGTSYSWGVLGQGFLFSVLVGLAAIHFMMAFVSKYSLLPFVLYRVVLGGVLLLYFL